MTPRVNRLEPWVSWQNTNFAVKADGFHLADGHLDASCLPQYHDEHLCVSAIVNASSYSSRRSSYSSANFFGHVFMEFPAQVINHFVAFWVWLAQSVAYFAFNPFINFVLYAWFGRTKLYSSGSVATFSASSFCRAIAGWNCSCAQARRICNDFF